MAGKKTQEMVVGAQVQNNLTHPIPILGHVQGADLGLEGGTGAALTIHEQDIANGGNQSFGPLEPGALYEFSHAPDATPYALDDFGICYRTTATQTDAAQLTDYRMVCGEGSPYFIIKLQPGHKYVNFFNPTGGGARVITIRRLV